MSIRRSVLTRGLRALTIVLPLSAGVSAQAKRAPVFPDDFEYIGISYLPYAIPTVGGTAHQFSKGLALRVVNGDLLAYIVGNHPQVLNVYVIPFNATTGKYGGTAIYTKTYALDRLGLPPNDGVEVRGLYWDEPTQRMYVSGGHVYDGDAQAFPVLARLKLDDASSSYTVEGNWRFDRRKYPYSVSAIKLNTTSGKYEATNGSDKMMMGGTLPVPTSVQAQYHVSRLAQGFGGYESVAGYGPISMGPALATFDPPAAGAPNSTVTDPSTYIVAKSVMGFPFTSSITAGVNRAPRDPHYINDFSKDGIICGGTATNAGGEDWPRTVSGPEGYWTIGDWIWQGATAIETPTLSGVLVLATEVPNRIWYGVNSGCDGVGAALNAWGWKHVLYTYTWDELGAVAFGGKRQDQVHGTFYDFSFPGLTYPIGCASPGVPTGCRGALPDRQFMVTGVTFEPTRQLFAVTVWNLIGASSRPRLAIWRVRDATAPALPVAPFGLEVVTS